MIVIVDDQYEGFNTLKNLMEELQSDPVVFKYPEEVMPFLADHAMDVRWMMIDEVFDHRAYARGMDLGREIMDTYDYLPLVMYTANDYDTVRAVEALARVGFTYFFNKNSIAKDSVVEDAEGKVAMVSAKQMLKQHLNDIPTLASYKQKMKFRARHKEDIIAAELACLNELEVKRFKSELNDPTNLRAYIFKFDDHEVPLRTLFKGWRDVDLYSEQQLADEIKGSKFLPHRFAFQNKIWRELFDAYQAASSYPEKSWKRDIAAFDFLLELIAHDKAPQPGTPASFTIKSHPEHLNGSFGKKSNNDEQLFVAKMVARRVVLAYTTALQYITLEEIVPLLKWGHNNTIVSRVKADRNGQKNVGERDIYPFFNTELELSISKKNGVNNDEQIFVEEIAFRRFVKANISECYALLQEIMADVKAKEIRTISNLKRFLQDFKERDKHTYADWTAKLENARHESTGGMINIINYILKD